MKISRKAEYALRAILILAGSAPGKPMQIQELSQAGDIPTKFLEQILLDLKRAGYLRSKRGKGGGYQLDRPARTISLGHIIELVDGRLLSLSEAAPVGTSFTGASGLASCFRQLDEEINEKLLETTLDAILAASDTEDNLAFEI